LKPDGRAIVQVTPEDLTRHAEQYTDGSSAILAAIAAHEHVLIE